MADSDADADADRDDAARMDLEPDAWHETEDGYYIDCPECGAPATLSNLVDHGRCNGFLDEQEEWMEFDVTDVTCSAKLSLELAYWSEPDAES